MHLFVLKFLTKKATAWVGAWALALLFFVSAAEAQVTLPQNETSKSKRSGWASTSVRHLLIKQRLSYGGGLSFQFQPFIMEIHPRASFALRSNWDAGLALPLQIHTTRTVSQTQGGVNTHTDGGFGIGAFTRWRVYKIIAVYGEYTSIYTSTSQATGATQWHWQQALRLGGGLSYSYAEDKTPLKDKKRIYVYALYDPLHNQGSVYLNAFQVRLGIMF